MHVEIQVALNFLISFLYNKLPRRRVNQFGEELENALKLKFEGHWYPEKPYKGSAFRCVKTTPPLDPVFEIAARESGTDIIDIQENLPQELSIWIDPGEVSYRMSEKGPVKILYSESDRPHDLENSDREVIRTFNPEAQCFKPIEATAMAFGSLSLGPGSNSPPSLHVIPNGFSSSPMGNTNGSNASGAAAAAAAVAVVVNGNGSGSGVNSPNGNSNLINSGPSVAPSPIYKSFNSGSMGPSGFLPKPSSSNVTFTTATFAQTKFGSTKLKSNTKRSHRMSPTEFSNYIKQRALQQQQAAASAVSPNGNDRMNNDRGGLSSGMTNGVHSPSNLTYVHGSPNGTGLSSGNISPQNSRSMSPIGNSVNGNCSLDSVSNLLFMGNHSVCTTATSPITHSPSSSLSSFYSGNGGMAGSSIGHGSISPRHHPSHHSGLTSSLNGLYGSSSSTHNIDSQLADLLGSSSLLPKSSSPSMSNGNNSTSPNNNNVFNRFASLFDKTPIVGSSSNNPYLSSNSVNINSSSTNRGTNNNNNNIITSVASNSSAASSIISIINNNNSNLHPILSGDNSPISSQCYPSNTILGSSGLQVNSLFGSSGHQSSSTDQTLGNVSPTTVNSIESVSSSVCSSSPSTISLSATSVCSPAASSPTIAVPSSPSASLSSLSTSSSASSSPSSSSSMPSTSPVPVTSATNSSVSPSSATTATSPNKGYDSFSFSLNGVSYPNQYQHLLVAN